MSNSPSIGSATVYLQNPQSDRLKQINRRLRRALKKLKNFSIQNSSELKQRHNELTEIIARIDKIRKKLVGIQVTDDSKSLIEKITTKLDRCDNILRSAHMTLVDTHDQYARTSPQLAIHEYFGGHEETQARRDSSDQDKKELTFADLFIARESYCSNTVTA